MKRQEGFGVAGVLIVVLLLLIVGFVAYRVQQADDDIEESQQINSFQECVDAGNPVMESYPEQCAANGQTFTNPDQSVDEPAEEQKASDTDTWYPYTSPQKLYSLRLPDGWKFLNIAESDNIYARSSADAVYAQGVPAKVTVTEGGWDGPSVVSIYIHDAATMDKLSKEGMRETSFTTNSGDTADVYVYEQTEEPDGIGYAKGQKARIYYFTKGDKTLVISHVYGNGVDNQTVIVEKALKTLDVKL